MEQLNNNEYNILVVEDDKEIREGIEIFLKSKNVLRGYDGCAEELCKQKTQ